MPNIGALKPPAPGLGVSFHGSENERVFELLKSMIFRWNRKQGEEIQTNFESTKPARHYAELYRDDDLPGGHVIMLGADGASKRAAISALKRYPGGFQLGGGVNTDNAEQYIEAGASHVIVTSFVFRDGILDEARLDELVNKVGKDKIVLDLSCRKKDDGLYYVVTDRWQKWSDLSLRFVPVWLVTSSGTSHLVLLLVSTI